MRGALKSAKVRNCIVCGKEFIAKSPNGKTCSEECRKIRRKETSKWNATKALAEISKRNERKRQDERAAMMARLAERDRRYAAEFGDASLTGDGHRGRNVGTGAKNLHKNY